jgi:dienelactone hydrolase
MTRPLDTTGDDTGGTGPGRSVTPVRTANPSPTWRRGARATLVALLAVALLGAAPAGVPTALAQDSMQPEFLRVSPSTNSGFLPAGSVASWRNAVPGIADVRIGSTIDGHQQPALWLAPNEAGPRPLLVALHSWSVGYDQVASIPYANWARQNGWAMIHPDFRGVSDNAAATGSDLAVQDIIDAVDWAMRHADIDPSNVYLIGFSGGGMMSLNMAGRHPDRFAGAVSWVPIYDLVEWYRYSARQSYVSHIRASCGGDPLVSETARAECAGRSPRAHLDGAREARIPVYIGHGLGDRLVLPEHAVWAFNHLADPADRLTPDESAAIAGNTLPAHLHGQMPVSTYFRAPDPTPLFSRRSGNATLVLFSGGHNAVFNPGLEWMVHQVALSDPSPEVEGAITRLYGASFGRDPDPNGQAYWTRLYLHGRSLSAIAGQFTSSPEFRARYGDLDDADFVRQVYRNVLGREPDPGGLAYWTDMLRSGRTRGWVMIGFSQSPEMRASTDTP